MHKIGITGMSEKAPGISVARCIKTGCPDIHLVAFGEAMDAGMYNYVDASYVVEPYDIDAIVKISLAKGIGALIPNMDDDVEAFAENIDVFYDSGIKVLIPRADIVRIANDKLETYRYACSKDISMPETCTFSENLNWEPPFFLKGRSRGVFRVRSQEESVSIFHYLKQMGEQPIAQKNLDGEPYCVSGFVYKDNIIIIMIKKLKIAENGTTIIGVTIYDEALLSITEELIMTIGWEGPFELEFIHNDGYHLLEINSRFPSWIDVGVGAGLNLPAILADLLFEKKIDNYKYRTGIVCIKFPMSLITDIDKIVKMNIVGGIE